METTKNGVAKFCDLGLGGVTITIGEADHCNEVVVRDISMSWGQERIVNVVHNRDYCNEDELQTTGCAILLRFVNERGGSIPQVQFDPLIGSTRIGQSDSYGRAHVRMQKGQTLTATARSEGYKPEKFDLKCAQLTSKDEVLVTLHGAK